MKTLVFNDTHFSDKFDSELFDYIVKLVKSADQVVINGDFWDAYLTTFDAFVTSEWKRLFPLLKEKHTVYIFGNHDKKEFMDDRYSLFSDLQTMKYKLKSGKSTFVIEHGHLFAPTYDAQWLFKNNILVRPFYKLLIGFITKVTLARNIHRYFEYSDGYKKLEHFILEVSKQVTTNTYHIFGHAHIHLFVPENNVIVVGVMQKNRMHHLIIENGAFTLIPQEQQYE